MMKLLRRAHPRFEVALTKTLADNLRAVTSLSAILVGATAYLVGHVPLTFDVGFLSLYVIVGHGIAKLIDGFTEAVDLWEPLLRSPGSLDVSLSTSFASMLHGGSDGIPIAAILTVFLNSLKVSAFLRSMSSDGKTLNPILLFRHLMRTRRNRLMTIAFAIVGLSGLILPFVTHGVLQKVVSIVALAASLVTAIVVVTCWMLINLSFTLLARRQSKEHTDSE